MQHLRFSAFIKKQYLLSLQFRKVDSQRESLYYLVSANTKLLSFSFCQQKIPREMPISWDSLFQ